MNRFSFLMLSAASVLLSCPAHAQSVDYGALQQMFGEPVTTSATGKPQRASDVPVTMEIISADEIRRSGAVDIPTILSRVAGFDYLQWGPTAADMSIRGYNQPQSPRLLVLINGRQVYLDHYGYTAWSALPITMSEIRQIEVVKGPNTALFGHNAAAGVINIITYNPLYDDTHNEYAVMGTQDRYELGGVRTFHNKDKTLGLRLSAHGFQSSDFGSSLDVQNFPGLDPFKRAVNADLLYQLTPNSQLGVEGSFTVLREQSQLTHPLLSNYSYNEGSGKISYVVDSSLGLIQAQSYINSNDNRLIISGLAGLFKEDNAVWVNQVSDLIKVDADHTLRLSMEHRYNRINVSNSLGADWGEMHYNVVSPGVMWDWAVADDVSLTNAVRFDHLKLNREGTFPANFPLTNDDWDRSINTISYNSGLVWRASNVDTLRLQTARGIQAPPMIQMGAFLSDLSGFGGAAITGNPHLNPVVVTNYELGYERKIEEIRGRAEARVFHQFTQDAILNLRQDAVFDIPPGPGAGVQYFINGGHSIMDGIEFELDGKFGKGWRWGANYTFMTINDHYDPSATIRQSEAEDHTPRHVVNLNLGWGDETWELDGYLRYQSSYVSYNEFFDGTEVVAIPDRVDGFVTLAGRAGYKVSDNLTVALSGQQLNARTIKASGGGRDPERRVFLSVTGTF